MKVLIGNSQGERVEIEVLACEDHDWLTCRVFILVSGFNAEYSSWFERHAFARLHNDLSAVYRDLAGTATFRTTENQLEFDFEVTKMGGVSVREVGRTHEGDVQLTFVLGIDQTYLPPICRDLKAILERY